MKSVDTVIFYVECVLTWKYEKTQVCVSVHACFYLCPARLKLAVILERVQRGILQQAVENSISLSVCVWLYAHIQVQASALQSVDLSSIKGNLNAKTGDIYFSEIQECGRDSELYSDI